mmetsp:Transcript_73639/g.204704  ORF Transcript_73639/g.204704 Transcript_73639/m.204704 type:complete len:230 (+) Transcript_73639:329-1018(+)
MVHILQAAQAGGVVVDAARVVIKVRGARGNGDTDGPNRDQCHAETENGRLQSDISRSRYMPARFQSRAGHHVNLRADRPRGHATEANYSFGQVVMTEAVFGQVVAIRIFRRNLPLVLLQRPAQAEEVLAAVAGQGPRAPAAVQQVLLRKARQYAGGPRDLPLHHADGAEGPAGAASPLVSRRAHETALAPVETRRQRCHGAPVPLENATGVGDLGEPDRAAAQQRVTLI